MGDGVTREKVVAVGGLVAVGRCVAVAVGTGLAVAVQVGGSAITLVGEAVGNESGVGSAGGGNGLRNEYGLLKITTKPDIRHRTLIKMRAVNILRIRSLDLEIAFGS